MSQFPTIIPTFTDLDGSLTLAANNHAARHNKVHEELAALATKVGIDSSTDANSLDKKTATLRTDVTALQASVSPLLVDPTTKAYVDSAILTAVGAAKQALYPIGSYYINETDGTNPGTLLGFGTWSQVKDTFILAVGNTYAANTTGGEATHILTPSETAMKDHTHNIGVNNTGGYVPNGLTPNALIYGSFGNGAQSNGYPTDRAVTSAIGSGIVQGVSGGASNGTAHNNMPPYKTAYVWKRTA